MYFIGHLYYVCMLYLCFNPAYCCNTKLTIHSYNHLTV